MRPIAGFRCGGSHRSTQASGPYQSRERHGLLARHLHEEFVREDGWFRGLREGGDGDGGGIATGRVAAINSHEICLRLDETVDGPVEEFALNAPARGVFPGDEVRVNYRNVEGKKIALRIEELSSRQ